MAWSPGIPLLPPSTGPLDDPVFSLLAGYDLSRDAGLRRDLPRALEEISGLATSPDGRLFAHNDERAVIFELDPASGDVLKAFSAGVGGAPGDFEGLAILGDRFFLLSSGGDLLEVGEGPPGSSLRYRIHRTGLGAFCEMEGLAFDPREEALLLPCKEATSPGSRGHLVVYTVPVNTMEPYLVPRVFIPFHDLEALGIGPEFHTSAIEVHPGTGSILLLAAREEVILEIDANGRPVAATELKRKDHPQPEGLALLLDGTLVIADEGQGNPGRLTRYPPRSGNGRVDAPENENGDTAGNGEGP